MPYDLLERLVLVHAPFNAHIDFIHVGPFARKIIRMRTIDPLGIVTFPPYQRFLYALAKAFDTRSHFTADFQRGSAARKGDKAR
jgi:hypothetical protein